MDVIKCVPKIIRNFISQFFEKKNEFFLSILKLIPRREHYFRVAESFQKFTYLPDYKENYRNIIKLIDEESKKVIDDFLSMQQYIFTHNYIDISLIQWVNTLKKADIIEIKNKFGKITEKDDFFKYNENVFKKHSGMKYIPNNLLPIKGDILDCGADYGDSAWMFVNYYSPRRLYAFEPNNITFKRLQKFVAEKQLDSVIPVKKGIDIISRKSNFMRDGRASHIIQDQKSNKHDLIEIIEVTTIDDFVQENDVIPDIIKMDIEGMEYNAIIGAEKTIKKYKPILLISLYHTPKDFFEIPILIHQWNENYILKIRKLVSFNYPACEIMMIAYIS